MEVVLSVNMVNEGPHVRIAEVVQFVNVVYAEAIVRTAEVVQSASTAKKSDIVFYATDTGYVNQGEGCIIQVVPPKAIES